MEWDVSIDEGDAAPGCTVMFVRENILAVCSRQQCTFHEVHMGARKVTRLDYGFEHPNLQDFSYNPNQDTVVAFYRGDTVGGRHPYPAPVEPRPFFGDTDILIISPSRLALSLNGYLAVSPCLGYLVGGTQDQRSFIYQISDGAQGGAARGVKRRKQHHRRGKRGKKVLRKTFHLWHHSVRLFLHQEGSRLCDLTQVAYGSFDEKKRI